MTEDHSSRTIFLMFVVLFAFLMLFVLFTAIRATSADVIPPSVDGNVMSIGASEAPER